MTALVNELAAPTLLMSRFPHSAGVANSHEPTIPSVHIVSMLYAGLEYLPLLNMLVIVRVGSP
jgi:hypothetical protein